MQEAYSRLLLGDRYAALLAVSDLLRNRPASRELLPARLLFEILAKDSDAAGGLLVDEEGILSPDAYACNELDCLALPLKNTPVVQSCPTESGLFTQRCGGWNLVRKVLEYREFISPTLTPEDADLGIIAQSGAQPTLPELFTAFACFRNTALYRLALHLACVSCYNDPEHTQDELREIGRLMMKSVESFLGKGVRRITEALLICDLNGMRICQDIFETGDRLIEQALTHARALLRETIEPLRSHPVLDNLLLAKAVLFYPALTPHPGTSSANVGHPSSAGVVTPAHREIPKMYLKLFGGFELYFDDTPCTDSQWGRRKIRELLARVALARGCDVSRDALIGMLWPNLDDLHARDSFYTLWRQFRILCEVDKGADIPYIIRTESSCRVNRLYLDADIMEFDTISRELAASKPDDPGLREKYLAMERLYRGELLKNDPAGEDCLEERIWYESIFIDTMICASGHAADAKDALSAIWFARRALEESDGREDVYRALMRAQILAGQRTSAVQTFEKCRNYLYDEFGITPARKTYDLYNEAVSPLFRSDNAQDLGWKL